MHKSALNQMQACVEQFMPADRHYRVVDLGSRLARDTLSHRDLLTNHDCSFLGVDLQSGLNVDIVMRRPYRIPLASNSVDVVMSGQVFEHIPFPFATMLEIARILRPNGLAFLTAPSRGHEHNVYDCWRFYPDSMRALAAFSALRLEKAATDFPPKSSGRFDYSNAKTYWGDTIGVFRKPTKYPRIRLTVVRTVLRWWSNSVSDLDACPIPD